MTKTVVIFSGGMDSTVLLADVIEQGDEVLALSVDYGQRHKKELEYAAATCQHFGVTHEVADLSGISRLLGGSSQTDPDIPVPHGHYAADTMKQTVVPNRNMIMLSVATGWAISQKADRVAYAAHAGDHTIYPDCRESFAQALDKAIQLCDWHELELWRPYVGITKADIVTVGVGLGVPFGQTWSCYEGGDIHCGACGTCVERREAFVDAGVEDPTEYRETPEFAEP